MKNLNISAQLSIEDIIENVNTWIGLEKYIFEKFELPPKRLYVISEAYFSRNTPDKYYFYNKIISCKEDKINFMTSVLLYLINTKKEEIPYTRTK